MTGKYLALLNPFKLASVIRNRFWLWVARELKFYLAVTPLEWGNGNQVKSNLRVGQRVELADVVLNCRSGRIEIGDDVFFGHGVQLLTGRHDIRKRGQARKDAVPASGYDIIIHRGVWIASGVIVLGPCEIGEDSVIRAGSVVTGSIPAGVIYGGTLPPVSRQIEFEKESRAMAYTIK